MPKKKPTPATDMDAMRREFLKQAEELWTDKEKQFLTVLEDGEKKAVNVTFCATLDFSESAAVLTTKIRFSEVFTDSRTTSFDDPHQLQVPGTTPSELDPPTPKKKKRGKKDEEESQAEPMEG